VIQQHTKCCVRQKFGNSALKLQQFFFSHSDPLSDVSSCALMDRNGAEIKKR
jgi:hypothetical protein